MPGAHPRGEVRVHRPHAPLAQHSGDAVQLQMHEPLRLGCVHRPYSEHVTQQRQQRHPNALCVVQVVHVPHIQDVTETGGDLEVRLCVGNTNENDESEARRCISDTAGRIGEETQQGVGRAVSELWFWCCAVAGWV